MRDITMQSGEIGTSEHGNRQRGRESCLRACTRIIPPLRAQRIVVAYVEKEMLRVCDRSNSNSQCKAILTTLYKLIYT